MSTNPGQTSSSRTVAAARRDFVARSNYLQGAVAHVEEARLAADRQRAAADDLHPGVLLRVVRGGDADAAVEAELADREVEHLRPDQPEVEHVRAAVRGALDQRLGHRRRGDAHVAPDGDPARLELLDVRAPDRVRALLVELGRMEPADVVRLEDLRVEHGPMLWNLAEDRLTARSATGVRWRRASTIQGWNASSPPSSSSTSSARRSSSRRSDPEVVRRRVTAYFDQVSQCISTHGGIVEKFAGDAVMAAFGIPQAHEDDAERAVRAAAAILESVHELGLEARIGVESGEVVADESDSTFATGEAVNVAARLQQLAEPGEILVGSFARRLTLAAIDTEERGFLELKGFDDPLPGLEADGRPRRHRARALDRGELRRPRVRARAARRTRSPASSATAARTC